MALVPKGYGHWRGAAAERYAVLKTGKDPTGAPWVTYKITPVDCHGRGIPKDGDSYKRTIMGKIKWRGWVDKRTLKATAAGCCPPQMVEEQIKVVETDAVLEAIKLHKRGYFGGGG